jgi:hypothetical protein
MDQEVAHVDTAARRKLAKQIKLARGQTGLTQAEPGPVVN